LVSDSVSDNGAVRPLRAVTGGVEGSELWEGLQETRGLLDGLNPLVPVALGEAKGPAFSRHSRNSLRIHL